ncbi:hypothetical protein [Sulfidibacter corallicola]|uniref:Uncharacterized protein n=1 Tax=Sulfidibacter corallicola TaxID=2818388 RepID=A0A8A4TIA3_SULCO|nr:hypothetical protein [Sulfidibacter corallicola]QTD48508.1 hypothetical protein J3U87_23255 [Sulfidibacter corallicola]
MSSLLNYSKRLAFVATLRSREFGFFPLACSLEARFALLLDFSSKLPSLRLVGQAGLPPLPHLQAPRLPLNAGTAYRTTPMCWPAWSDESMQFPFFRKWFQACRLSSLLNHSKRLAFVATLRSREFGFFPLACSLEARFALLLDISSKLPSLRLVGQAGLPPLPHLQAPRLPLNAGTVKIGNFAGGVTAKLGASLFGYGFIVA